MAKKKRKYSKKASDEVSEALHKQKRGEQRSGTKGKAKSRKQAIAIGLAKARKEGAKVPDKSSSSPKKASKKRRSTAKKKSTGKKKSTAKKKSTGKRSSKK